MRDVRRKRAVLLLAGLVAAVAFLAACDDTYIVSDYLTTFLDSQDSGKQTANNTARTGDDGVDGILEAANTVNWIGEVDKASEEGMQMAAAGNPEEGAALIDKAIEERPHDATHRRARAHVALGMDHAQDALDQWEEQDRIARMSGWHDEEWYWVNCFEDAERAEYALYADHPDLEQWDDLTRSRAWAIYSRAATSLETLEIMADESGDDEAELELMGMAADYRVKAQQYER